MDAVAVRLAFVRLDAFVGLCPVAAAHPPQGLHGGAGAGGRRVGREAGGEGGEGVEGGHGGSR